MRSEVRQKRERNRECDLLEITSDPEKQRIDEICGEAHTYSSRGYCDKAKELLSAGLYEYPDSFCIMCDLNKKK